MFSQRPLATRGGARLGAATRAHEVDLTHGVEAADTRRRDPAGSQIGLDRQARDERDAVAGEHGAPHGFLQTELEPHVKLAQARPGLAQLVLDHLSDTGPFLHDDERLSLQLVERDGLACEFVTRRARQHDLVPEERLEDDAAVPPSGADDAELERAIGDLVDDRLRVGDREPDAHVRVVPLELAQEDGHNRAARPGGGAELERSRDRALVVGGDLLEQVLLGGKQSLSGGVEPAAGLGGLDAAA